MNRQTLRSFLTIGGEMPFIPGARIGLKRINAIMQATMLRALYEGPCTVQDLCEACGGGIVAIRGYILALRKLKLVHIAEWHEAANGAAVIPAYVWGPDKKDVKRPVKTNAERSARYKARKRDEALLNLTRKVDPT